MQLVRMFYAWELAQLFRVPERSLENVMNFSSPQMSATIRDAQRNLLRHRAAIHETLGRCGFREFEQRSGYCKHPQHLDLLLIGRWTGKVFSISVNSDCLYLSNTRTHYSYIYCTENSFLEIKELKKEVRSYVNSKLIFSCKKNTFGNSFEKKWKFFLHSKMNTVLVIYDRILFQSFSMLPFRISKIYFSTNYSVPWLSLRNL